MLPKEDRDRLRWAVDVLRKAIPSKFIGLHIGQYRAMEAMYRVDGDSGTIPFGGAITPGNGWGKTTLLALDFVGWVKGRSWLNEKSFPESSLDYYDSLSKWRDSGTLSIRLVCEAEDMKEGGSVHDAIRDLLPDAVFTAKESGGCYRQIRVPHPTISGVFNTLSVRTFEQEVRKHSGTNVHRLLVNEPMPHVLWGENIGRLRSKKNEISGSFALFATVLNQAPYVSDMINGGSGGDGFGRVFHVRGSIWENCVGSELPDDKVVAIEQKYGSKIPVDASTGDRWTGGVLTRSTIEGMIRNWKSTAPHEVEAREWGEFMHLEGRLLQLFSRDVHIVPSKAYTPLPKSYPVVQIVDPHDRKPDLSIWAAITPMRRLVVVGEYPNLPYVHIKDRTENIEQTCESWRHVEAANGWSGRVVARIGDPNKFHDKDPVTGDSLWKLYHDCGFVFDTHVNDDNDMGLRELNSWLSWDTALRSMNPTDPMAQPRLSVIDTASNVIEGCFKCAWREHRDPNAAVSTKIDPKYKHVFDVLRYLVVWMKSRTFDELRPDVKRQSEAEVIKAARMGAFAGGSKVRTFASMRHEKEFA